MAGTTFRSGIAALFRAVRSLLVREGVNVGGTAGYPRVEIHSLVENPPVDKGGGLRSVDLVVECMSEERLADAVAMTEENIVRLFAEAGFPVEGFSVAGVVAGQVRMLEEQAASDQNKVLYRILQDMTVWIQATSE